MSSFKEKPSLDVAKSYLQSGNFLWNAGMFISPIGLLLSELKSNVSEMNELEDSFRERIKNNKKIDDLYDRLPKESIDYAVIEKTSQVDVVTAQFDWNDLGSWDALESVVEKKKKTLLPKLRIFKPLMPLEILFMLQGKR